MTTRQDWIGKTLVLAVIGLIAASAMALIFNGRDVANGLMLVSVYVLGTAILARVILTHFD